MSKKIIYDIQTSKFKLSCKNLRNNVRDLNSL
jgi:hypothetical protein